MKMESHISSIDTKLSSFCSKISDHERRLANLEKSKEDTGLAKILAKTLMYAIFVIGSLAGAGGLIAKLFTM